MIKLRDIIKNIVYEQRQNLLTPEKASEIFLMFGIENTLKMDKKELEKHWKLLTKKYHPDIGGNPHSLKFINAAYDVLKDYNTSSNNTDNKQSNNTNDYGIKKI